MQRPRNLIPAVWLGVLSALYLTWTWRGFVGRGGNRGARRSGARTAVTPSPLTVSDTSGFPSRAVRHAPLALVLAALAAWYLPATWSDQLASLGGDSAVYVLAARSYSFYLPADPVTEAIAVESQFPPLYPLLLSLSGGAFDLHLAHAATTASLLAALALLHFWFLGIGVSRAASAAGVAVVGAMPGTFLQAFYLHSESLYLAFVTGFLLTLTANAGRSGTRVWVAVGLAAAALMTRSAGVSLLPALALWLWRGRVPLGRAGAALGVSVLPSLVWAFVRQPEHSYGTGLLHHYAALEPDAMVERLLLQADALGHGLLNNVLQTGTFVIPVMLLGAVALAAAVPRFLRGREDAWYVAAYIALIVVWPYPAEAGRFAWILLGPLMGYLLLAAELAGRWAPKLTKLIRAAPVLLVAMMVAPSTASAVQRYFHPLTRELPAVRHLPEYYGADFPNSVAQAQLHLEFIDAVETLAAEVPPDACVFSIKPSLVAYFGHRDSFVPPFEDVDDTTFSQWVAAKGCRYFLLLGSRSPSYSKALYPLNRMPERLEILRTYYSSRDELGRVVAALAVLK